MKVAKQRWSTILSWFFMASAAGFAPPALSLDFDPINFPICFGTGSTLSNAGGVYELDGTAGVELLVIDERLSVFEDLDFDGFSDGSAVVTLKALQNDGTVIWSKALGMTLPEVLSAAPGTFAVLPQFNPGNSITDLLPIPFFCQGAVVLTHASQEYLVVTLGVSAAQGTAIPGTGLSKINVYVIAPGTGTVLATHTIRPRPGRFFLAFESVFVDYDGDGNDELVQVYSAPRAVANNEQTVELLILSYDLLSKAKDGQAVVFQKTTLLNDN